MKYLLLFLSMISLSAAAEKYYRMPLTKLLSEKDSKDSLLRGQVETKGMLRASTRYRVSPQARFSSHVYLGVGSNNEEIRMGLLPRNLVAVFLSDGKRVEEGFLDVWNAKEKTWKIFKARLDPSLGEICEPVELEKIRSWHYTNLENSEAIGKLWFREQLAKDRGASLNRRSRMLTASSYEVMSGARAIAENLALDRDVVLGRGDTEKMVPISEIEGVTVAPIPWAEMMPEGEARIDPLSLAIPEDQHVLIVPTLAHLFGLMERLESEGTPVIQAFSVRNAYRELPLRYRKQMGLDLPKAIAKLLPVKSVAVTGGDPFFPSGSDVAVVFETGEPKEVFRSIRAALQLQGWPLVEKGESYVVSVSEDRSRSSFLKVIGGNVVVSNSAHQIEKLTLVAEKKEPALGQSEEYQFFRHRYAMNPEEDAYLFLSDATLRRWAGPRVRIGASRRNRAFAALAQLTGKLLLGESVENTYEDLLGEVGESEGVVSSKNYGSLSFIKPIAELEISEVTEQEKLGYERWRGGYEQGWSKFFDPIAIRLTLAEDSEEMDLTVLPLRGDSRYRQFLSLVGNATLSGKAIHVSPSVAFQYSMAIDHEGATFKMADGFLSSSLPGFKVNPLSWVGSSVSVMGEDSPDWKTLVETRAWFSFPVLLRVESKSSLKLALFLAGMKTALETSAPDLVRWETRKYGERSYVVMHGRSSGDEEDFMICYAALPSAWLVSLREDTLKRAIDWEKVSAPKKETDAQVFAQVSPKYLRWYGEAMMGEESWSERCKKQSWRALPILNEWRKRFEKEDPVAFHKKMYAADLFCPGGQGYRWNEEAKTMESVAFGFPAEPGRVEKPLSLLDRVELIMVSGDFKDDGLRLRVKLQQGK